MANPYDPYAKNRYDKLGDQHLIEGIVREPNQHAASANCFCMPEEQFMCQAKDIEDESLHIRQWAHRDPGAPCE